MGLVVRSEVVSKSVSQSFLDCHLQDEEDNEGLNEKQTEKNESYS